MATTRLTQLAQPSTAYKRRVWLAVTGLALFLALYFLLAGWFLFTAYRLTARADQATFTGFAVGFCALFLGVFMLKPLFFVKRGGVAGALEITRPEQPRLFAFLDELADAATAPRPHRSSCRPGSTPRSFTTCRCSTSSFHRRRTWKSGSDS